jgi:hypothetical protein
VIRALFATAALGLAGCEPVAPPGFDRMPPEPEACGAKGMEKLLWKDRAVLAAMTFPAGTRVIEPGQPVTADYSAERLNIDLDRQGRITRVWCG